MNNSNSGQGKRIDHGYNMPRRRWYDYRPILFHALDLMSNIPADVCNVVAGEINGFAEQEYEAHDMVQGSNETASLKTIGKEKVLALYKSKKRQREIDQSDALHVLLNYLFVLPEKQQYALATQILGVSAIIYDYCSACQVFDKSVKIEDIRKLSDLYFDDGIESAKGTLEVIKAELRIMASQPPQAVGEWLVDSADGSELRVEGRSSEGQA